MASMPMTVASGHCVSVAEFVSTPEQPHAFVFDMAGAGDAHDQAQHMQTTLSFAVVLNDFEWVSKKFHIFKEISLSEFYHENQTMFNFLGISSDSFCGSFTKHTYTLRQFLGVGPKSHSQLWDPRLERLKLKGLVIMVLWLLGCWILSGL